MTIFLHEQSRPTPFPLGPNNYNTRYTERQLRILCIIVLTASCISICSGLVFYYFWFKVKFHHNLAVKKKLIFRHNLIFLWISINFLKAFMCSIYPIYSLSSDHYLFGFKTLPCSVIGYFIHSFITMSDYLNLIFSIHIFLLFFKPGLTKFYRKRYYNSYFNWKNDPTKKVLILEGGLYKWRYPIVALILIVPFVQVSFIYLDKFNFVSYGSFCYVRSDLWWCRMLVNWAMKYFILLVMILIYFSIYIFIALKYQELNWILKKDTGISTSVMIQSQVSPKSTRESSSRFKNFMAAVMLGFRFIFNSLKLQGDSRIDATMNYITSTFHKKDEEDKVSDDNIIDSNEMTLNYNIDNLNKEINQFNRTNLHNRRKNVMNQINLIFVYPLAFFFLTFIQLAAQCFRWPTTINVRNEPFALSCIVSISQSIDVFVVLWAFLIKERPWNLLKETDYDFDQQDEVEDEDPLTKKPAGGNSKRPESAFDPTNASTEDEGFSNRFKEGYTQQHIDQSFKSFKLQNSRKSSNSMMSTNPTLTNPFSDDSNGNQRRKSSNFSNSNNTISETNNKTNNNFPIRKKSIIGLKLHLSNIISHSNDDLHYSDNDIRLNNFTEEGGTSDIDDGDEMDIIDFLRR